MYKGELHVSLNTSSRPVWGAWIEIKTSTQGDIVIMSRPVWGAWIEIGFVIRANKIEAVAPRMGRVD